MAVYLTELRFMLPKLKEASPGLLNLLNGEKVSLQLQKGDSDRLARDAALGNPQAQYEMAKALTSKPHVSAENSRAAVKWLKKAVETKHNESSHLLGVLIARGQGIKANPPQAFDLFKRAAIMGYAPAQYDLARALLWGFGCDVNVKEALTWFRLAAAQGHIESELEAGISYEEGRGCETNLRNALQYYRKATTAGNKIAAYRMYLLTQKIAETPMQKKEALRWLESAAQLNHATAQYELARYLMQEKHNVRQAQIWLEKAAEQRHLQALLMLIELLAATQVKDNALKAYALIQRGKIFSRIATEQNLSLTFDAWEEKIRPTLAAHEKEKAQHLFESDLKISDVVHSKI